MMNRNIVIVGIVCALHAAANNMYVCATSSSISERNFTRRFGAYSYLLQEPSHYRPFEFDEKHCFEEEQENNESDDPEDD